MEKITINEIMEQLQAAITRYFETCTLFDAFSNDPDAVAADIDQHEDTCTLKQAFSNVTNGLKGEMTRPKAIELGRLALHNYIKEAAAEVNAKINQIDDNQELLSELAMDKMRIIDTSTDTVSIGRRLDEIKDKTLAVEYFLDKAYRVLQPDILAEAGPSIEYVNYLNLLDSVLFTLSNMDIKRYIQSGIDTYNAETKVLATFIKEIKSGNFKDAVISEKVDLPQVLINTPKDSVIEYIGSTVIDNVEKDPMKIFINIHGNLNKAYENLKSNVESFIKITKPCLDIDDDIEDLLEIHLNNVVLSYAEGSTTAEDYLGNTLVYHNAIDVKFNIIEKLINSLITTVNTLSIACDVYLHVHSKIDKATIDGSLGRDKITAEKK